MYYFELRDADERVLYYAGRFFDKLPGMRLEGRWFDHRCEVDQFPYIRREDLFAVPEWFRNAVVYNIFPDSFANGVERLEKKETHILRAGVVSSSRLGGTLEGIRLNLDYIHSLGLLPCGSLYGQRRGLRPTVRRRSQAGDAYPYRRCL